MSEKTLQERISTVEGGFVIIIALISVLILVSLGSWRTTSVFISQYNATEIISAGNYMMLATKQQSLTEKCGDVMVSLSENKSNTTKILIEIESSMDEFRDRIAKLEK